MRFAGLFVVLMACSRQAEPPVVVVSPELEQTAGRIDQYVAAGRTPAAFAGLATDLAGPRASMDPTVAADAELRLMALALPFAEEGRDRPIGGQIDRLALPVWAVLLDAPPATLETATAFMTRVCAGPLASCRDATGDERGVAIRAAAIHSANRRVRAALSRCVHCRGNQWDEIGRRWDSLDRDGQALLNELHVSPVHAQS